MESIRKLSPDKLIVASLALSIFISPYTTVIAVIAIVVYFMCNNQLKNIVESICGIYYVFAFYVMTLMVSVANNNFSGVLVSVALILVFMTAAYVRHVMTPDLFEVIINTSCAASLFSFAVVVLQKLGNTNIGRFRTTSTFMNANYYASITEVVILFCMYRLLKEGGKAKPFFILVLACNGIGLYLSNCRTAYVALCLGILLLVFLNRKYIAICWTLSCVGILSVVFISYPNLLPRGGTMSIDLENRISIWLTAVKGISNHPVLGQGFGTYQLIYEKYYGAFAMHAHNIILDPLLNFGLAGVLLMSLFLIQNLRSIRRMYSMAANMEISCLVYAVLGCVIFHGFTDITFFSIQPGLLILLVLAAAGIVEFPVPAAVRVPSAKPIMLMTGRRVSSPRNRSL